MSIRPVLRLGDPALRQRASEVPESWFGSEDLKALVNDLIDTKTARSGAGLAAPQINAPWRVVVVGMARNPRYPDAAPVPERVIINPLITPLSETTIAGWEGCLSVPGLRGEVARWANIRLQWRDLQGRCHSQDFSGFEARVMQHECDHLDGVLFPDRLQSPTAFGFEEELQTSSCLP